MSHTMACEVWLCVNCVCVSSIIVCQVWWHVTHHGMWGMAVCQLCVCVKYNCMSSVMACHTPWHVRYGCVSIVCVCVKCYWHCISPVTAYSMIVSQVCVCLSRATACQVWWHVKCDGMSSVMACQAWLCVKCHCVPIACLKWLNFPFINNYCLVMCVPLSLQFSFHIHLYRQVGIQNTFYGVSIIKTKNIPFQLIANTLTDSLADKKG